MTENRPHCCPTPDDDLAGLPAEWTCPECGQVWELRTETWWAARAE